MWIKRGFQPLWNAEGGAGGGAGAGAGAGATPWHQGVSPETLGVWQNKGYDLSDPVKFGEAITKQYRDLESHMGVPPDRLIKLPKDAGDEAGWKGVYSRLGVPNEAKEYDFTGIKHADGTDVPQALADTLRTAMLNARVPKDRGADVVKSVVKALDDARTAEAANVTAKLTEEKGKLAELWGKNADFNKLTAMQGAKRLGVSEEAVAALEKVVGYSATMEMFRKVGAGTKEDTFVEGGSNNSGQPMTVDAARARKSELMADDAWQKRYLSGDAAAVREMTAIDMMIAGVAA